jgi:GDP-L-fucose synthase
MNLKKKRIYIAGAGGMVGSAIKKNLEKRNYTNLICPSSNELNLINQAQVDSFFLENKPEIVIVSAGKVGGILANNKYRAEFIYNNLMIEANLIHSSYISNVEKLVFLGSSCIYPKLASQPIKEEELLSGYLESTNEPYAVAKIAGIKLCENYYHQYGCNFFSVMPTNLYGENDNFDLENSHVIPALIRKFYNAKIKKEEKVKLWGTGEPRREFLYVEDLAEAIVFLLENVNARDLYELGISHLNIGTGKDIQIKEIALIIKKIIGFEGSIQQDTSKPDGTPRKLLDVSRLNKLGWNYKTSLDEGLRKTYNWFLEDLVDRI